ncbi:MAG: type III pantothenate kinase [Candidatus Carbobacillus altaicus]|nr:type III pantothenate kinase [Candidatus Carbobacillus altaicus]
MLLALDVGNTNIVVGVFENEALRASWRLSTDRRRTADELAVFLKHFFSATGFVFSDVDRVIISSVVPPLSTALKEMSERYFSVKPLIVGPGVKTGLNLKLDAPREVGADRIVNAVAALRLYGPPLIVIDFGTATTFCQVDEAGDYRGGVIAPGVAISMEALYQNAAKLPKVEIAPPPSVVGRNTVEAMQSGLFYGYIGLIEGMIERMKRLYKKPPKVVATGGLGRLFAEATPLIDVYEPDLTLYGLNWIAQLNA